MPKLVFLWTDVALFAIVLAALAYARIAYRSPSLSKVWRRVGQDKPAMCSAVVLACFMAIGLLDSVHYQPRIAPLAADTAPVYAPIVRSALDAVLDGSVLASPEKTYSAPLATRQFTKETVIVDGRQVREFPRLRYGGKQLPDPDRGRAGDVAKRAAIGFAAGLGTMAVVAAAVLAGLARRRRSWRAACGDLARERCALPWRAMLITLGAIVLAGSVAAGLASGYHVLGTTQTGSDVLRESLKSIRTALIIGSLTSLAMLPPAIALGISAGYFKGRIDDAIQYIYTTLTSIPGVLLVAACVLMMQVYIDNNPTLYPTSMARADLRLFLLCMILGLTGWSGLCRVLRAETLKLRELEYVQAARAFGVSHWNIMWRHLLPNVMHIVLITMVLEFSGLVLYEAVLSYLGIGVDPTMNSFGTMIDASRLEMSRDPMVWWGLLTAFIFMLALVLAANLFADAVRTAFDPRSRRFAAGVLA